MTREEAAAELQALTADVHSLASRVLRDVAVSVMYMAPEMLSARATELLYELLALGVTRACAEQAEAIVRAVEG